MAFGCHAASLPRTAAALWGTRARLLPSTEGFCRSRLKHQRRQALQFAKNQCNQRKQNGVLKGRQFRTEMPDELRVLEGWVIAAEPGFRDGNLL